MPRFGLTPRRVATVQGTFNLLGGLWPIVSMRTFERVTGPKVEDWLEQAVGALLVSVGATQLVAGRRSLGVPAPVLRLLGASSAAGLLAVDLVYLGRRRLPRIYALDAVTEAAFVLAWLVAG